LRKKVIVNSWKGITRACTLAVSVGMREKETGEDWYWRNQCRQIIFSQWINEDYLTKDDG